MLERASEATKLLMEYFPERAWAVGLALKEENAKHSRLERWHERQLVHFVEILVGSTGDLFRAHHEKRISTLAWVSRNLLELSIWIEFCTKSDANAKRFDDDAVRDMFGWSDAIRGMYKDSRDKDHADLTKKIADLKTFAASQGIAQLADDFKQVRKASEELGRQNEFIRLFKLYSKFAHPTAWVVKSASSIAADEDFRDMFFADGVDFAVMSITRIREKILEHFPQPSSQSKTE